MTEMALNDVSRINSSVNIATKFEHMQTSNHLGSRAYIREIVCKMAGVYERLIRCSAFYGLWQRSTLFYGARILVPFPV